MILIRIEILFPTVSLCKRQRLLSVLYHFQTESGETCVTPATERPQQQKEIELAEGGRCSSQLLSPQSKINVVPVNSRPVSTALVAWLLVLVVIIFFIFLDYLLPLFMLICISCSRFPSFWWPSCVSSVSTSFLPLRVFKSLCSQDQHQLCT